MNWSAFISTFAGVFLGEFLWGMLRSDGDATEEC